MEKIDFIKANYDAYRAMPDPLVALSKTLSKGPAKSGDLNELAERCEIILDIAPTPISVRFKDNAKFSYEPEKSPTDLLEAIGQLKAPEKSHALLAHPLVIETAEERLTRAISESGLDTLEPPGGYILTEQDQRMLQKSLKDCERDISFYAATLVPDELTKNRDGKKLYTMPRIFKIAAGTNGASIYERSVPVSFNIKHFEETFLSRAPGPLHYDEGEIGKSFNFALALAHHLSNLPEKEKHPFIPVVVPHKFGFLFGFAERLADNDKSYDVDYREARRIRKPKNRSGFGLKRTKPRIHAFSPEYKIALNTFVPRRMLTSGQNDLWGELSPYLDGDVRESLKNIWWAAQGYTKKEKFNEVMQNAQNALDLISSVYGTPLWQRHVVDRSEGHLPEPQMEEKIPA